MFVAAVLAVGSVTYVGLRIAGTDTRADAATTPPTIFIGHNAGYARLHDQAAGDPQGPERPRREQRLGLHATHTVTSNAMNSHRQPLFSA